MAAGVSDVEAAAWAASLGVAAAPAGFWTRDAPHDGPHQPHSPADVRFGAPARGAVAPRPCPGPPLPVRLYRAVPAAELRPPATPQECDAARNSLAIRCSVRAEVDLLVEGRRRWVTAWYDNDNTAGISASVYAALRLSVMAAQPGGREALDQQRLALAAGVVASALGDLPADEPFAHSMRAASVCLGGAAMELEEMQHLLSAQPALARARALVDAMADGTLTTSRPWAAPPAAASDTDEWEAGGGGGGGGAGGGESGREAAGEPRAPRVAYLQFSMVGKTSPFLPDRSVHTLAAASGLHMHQHVWYRSGAHMKFTTAPVKPEHAYWLAVDRFPGDSENVPPPSPPTEPDEHGGTITPGAPAEPGSMDTFPESVPEADAAPVALGPHNVQILHVGVRGCAYDGTLVPGAQAWRTPQLRLYTTAESVSPVDGADAGTVLPWSVLDAAGTSGTWLASASLRTTVDGCKVKGALRDVRAALDRFKPDLVVVEVDSYREDMDDPLRFANLQDALRCVAPVLFMMRNRNNVCKFDLEAFTNTSPVMLDPTFLKLPGGTAAFHASLAGLHKMAPDESPLSGVPAQPAWYGRGADVDALLHATSHTGGGGSGASPTAPIAWYPYPPHCVVAPAPTASRGHEGDDSPGLSGGRRRASAGGGGRGRGRGRGQGRGGAQRASHASVVPGASGSAYTSPARRHARAPGDDTDSTGAVEPASDGENGADPIWPELSGRKRARPEPAPEEEDEGDERGSLLSDIDDEGDSRSPRSSKRQRTDASGNTSDAVADQEGCQYDDRDVVAQIRCLRPLDTAAQLTDNATQATDGDDGDMPSAPEGGGRGTSDPAAVTQPSTQPRPPESPRVASPPLHREDGSPAPSGESPVSNAPAVPSPRGDPSPVPESPPEPPEPPVAVRVVHGTSLPEMRSPAPTGATVTAGTGERAGADGVAPPLPFFQWLTSALPASVARLDAASARIEHHLAALAAVAAGQPGPPSATVLADELRAHHAFVLVELDRVAIPAKVGGPRLVPAPTSGISAVLAHVRRLGVERMLLARRAQISAARTVLGRWSGLLAEAQAASVAASELRLLPPAGMTVVRQMVSERVNAAAAALQQAYKDGVPASSLTDIAVDTAVAHAMAVDLSQHVLAIPPLLVLPAAASAPEISDCSAQLRDLARSVRRLQLQRCEGVLRTAIALVDRQAGMDAASLLAAAVRSWSSLLPPAAAAAAAADVPPGAAPPVLDMILLAQRALEKGLPLLQRAIATCTDYTAASDTFNAILHQAGSTVAAAEAAGRVLTYWRAVHQQAICDCCVWSTYTATPLLRRLGLVAAGSSTPGSAGRPGPGGGRR